MERMRALMQESTAATNRLVSSAEGLRRQAQELQEAVSQFTLDGAASRGHLAVSS
jgi:methyl-accepting chemotaxis protein